MKKHFLALLLLLVVLTTSSCKKQTAGLVRDPVYPTSISIDDYEKRRNLIAENTVDEKLRNALNMFTFNTSSEILKNQPGNTSYSPFSAYMALALAASGSNKETKDELFNLLNLTNESKEYLSEQMGRLFRLNYMDNEAGTLKIANSLWLDNSITFKNSYTDNAASNFYASLHNVNFKDNSTPKLIGDWISKNTNDIIKPEIKLTDDQVLAIINTIYFKDAWYDEFNTENTAEDTFYVDNTNTVNAEFMSKTLSPIYNYSRGDNYLGIDLRLTNGGSIYFVLPEENITVDDLLGSPSSIQTLFDRKNTESAIINLKIPKFSYGNKTDLKDILKNLGITISFNNGADFSDITDTNILISSILQESHVAIDEKGVEAAAYTMIGFDNTSALIDVPETIDLIFNRPFIYSIISNDGSVLFIGTVKNPSQTN